MKRFEEAHVEMRRANELEPLAISKATGAGDVFYQERKYDQAIEQYNRALELDPNSGLTRWNLGNAYVHKGMHNEAIAEYRKAIAFSGDSPDELASLGYAYAVSSRTREAQGVIRDLKEQSKRRYISPTIIAFIHAGLGENDKAFAELEKAYELRDFILVFLNVDPTFDRLRSDPRFAKLVSRVGLPQ
jgi:tetratricopeptide (TPR) repeat protein